MDAGDGAEAVVVVFNGEADVVLGRLADLRQDLALVDALARLRLAAGSLGWSIHVRDPGAVLHELLDLTGLTDVIEQPH